MAQWRKVAVAALVLAVAAPAAMGAEEGWVQLFNGKDLTGWKGKPNGWKVEDGVLARQKGGGYVWTEKSYGNFVLDLEVKMGERVGKKVCNSGIFIRTDPRNAVHGGFEVQVFDSHGKKVPGKHDLGAVYDACAPKVNAARPAGEWNHFTITCNDNKIEVVLNDKPIIDMDLDQWTEARKNPDGSKNKFRTALKDLPREGHIGFQDHGHDVWYRNVRLKELAKEK